MTIRVMEMEEGRVRFNSVYIMVGDNHHDDDSRNGRVIGGVTQ